MLSWEKIDALPGWFLFQSYCVVSPLPARQAGVNGGWGGALVAMRVRRGPGEVLRFPL